MHLYYTHKSPELEDRGQPSSLVFPIQLNDSYSSAHDGALLFARHTLDAAK
jgi:hypothetical protein